MKRRTFLKASAAASGVLLTDRLYARPSTPLPLLAQLDAVQNDKILILVQLFGGNDGLNTVIPALDDNYYNIRPSISIAKNQCWNSIGDIYLHPALASGDKQGIAHMLDVGTLAIVQGVGYDHPNLSHFRSTDIWLSGINSSDPNVDLDTGWLGRFLEKRYPDYPTSLPQDPLSINFGGFSLALTSEKGRMGIDVADPSQLVGGTPSGVLALDPDASGTRFELEYDFVAAVAESSNTYAQRVKQAYAAGRPKLQGHYATDSFAQQMASVAALIAGGLDTRIYMVALGGFDTHVSQQEQGIPLGGDQPLQLSRLADAVAQFQYDLLMLDQAGMNVADRVVGLTVSEFGRRPYENGSLGTDHGAASVQFVFGTQVNSGIFGDPPDLTNFDSNGDLQWQIDYRQVYLSLMTSWLGMSMDDARTVLQDDTLTPVDVIRPQTQAVGASPNPLPIVAMNVAPNPFRGQATVSLTLPSTEHVSLTLVTPDGRVIQEIVDRTIAAGTHQFQLAKPSASGTFLLMLKTPTTSSVRIVESIN